MKGQRKYFVLVLVIVITTLLIGSFSGIVFAKEIKIGWSQRNLGCPYFVELHQYAIAEAEKCGAELYFLDATEDIAKQISDVEDLIAKKCDVIVIDPVDSVGSIPAVRAANKAGIPVVIVADPLDLSKDPDVKVETTVIGGLYFEGAYLAGQYAAKLIGNEKVNMVFINGPLGSQPGRDRITGFIAGMTMYQTEHFNTAYINVIAHGFGNWGTQSGLLAMEDILSAHPKVDVVVTANDAMALGALQAIKEAGRLNELKFLAACSDAQKEALEIILKGDYQGKYICSGMNWPRKFIPIAVDLAIKIVEGEKVPSFVNHEAILVTKENVKEYYDPNATF